MSHFPIHLYLFFSLTKTYVRISNSNIVRKLNIYKFRAKYQKVDNIIIKFSYIYDCSHPIITHYIRTKGHKYHSIPILFFLLGVNTFCYLNVHQRQTCGNQLQQQCEKLVDWDQLDCLSHCQCILAETITYCLQYKSKNIVTLIKEKP